MTISIRGVWMIAMRNTYKNKINNKIKSKIMKKTVRLTESDLSRIVKRVIKEDERKDGRSISIALRDVFGAVKAALVDIGGYNDSMERQAMDLATDILFRMNDELYYIPEQYRDELHRIINNEEEEDEWDKYDEEDEY